MESKRRAANLIATREKVTSYIQRNSHKTMSEFFSRNFASLSGLVLCIQTVDRKALPTNNTLSSKVVQKQRKESLPD